MRITLLALCLISLASCVATRKPARFFRKELKSAVEESPVFSKGFTGFHLVDAATGRELCAVQADRYFTPASNTKLLTLAVCLESLGDSLPGLEFRGTLSHGDTTTYLVAGTGDPSFLHPKFQAWQPVFSFLQDNAVRFIADPGRIPGNRFGPGWSWDDYSDYYAPELSSLPIFGNVLTIRRENERWRVYPERFQDSLFQISPEEKKQRGVRRAEFGDRLEIQVPDKQLPDYEAEVPFFQAEQKKMTLLADTLGWQPEEQQTAWPAPARRSFLYSVPVDTVCRRMLQQSDNFIAEQLLLLCAGIKFDTLRQAKIITWAKDSLFAGLPDPPRWVDGSGLSRYNLISPRFLTALLLKLYREQPRERLFSLFPGGGRSGTIENWYGGPAGQPYVFAKTGTLSGVHCLSGYLVTQKGRVLIFSFMHNNFIGSNTPWKQEMQRLLERMRVAG